MITFLIAAILIYQFKYPWWMYIVALLFMQWEFYIIKDRCKEAIREAGLTNK